MKKLICMQCSAEYPLDEKIWCCSCGGVLDLDYNTEFPISKIERRAKTMWRYREALPLEEDKHIVSFNEGFTPLFEMQIDGHSVFLKQDYLFPTGSFKDRGASVLVSKARELGIKRVVEDSSGNAGCAIAAYCAQAQLVCDVFVPEDIASEKLIQMQSYGIKLRRISGSREDAAESAREAAGHYYYASHYWNPFFLHGTKTLAFEICEQLNWRAPQTVVLPVGNGTLLIGAYLGFTELIQAGVINRLPRMIGVQAKQCAPIANAYQRNKAIIPAIDAKDTIAEGIAIARPVRGPQIITAVRMSNGDFVVVTEKEIKRALKYMFAQGFFIEPTGGATIAGLRKYLETAQSNEVIVTSLTGHGLKAAQKIQQIS